MMMNFYSKSLLLLLGTLEMCSASGMMNTNLRPINGGSSGSLDQMASSPQSSHRHRSIYIVPFATRKSHEDFTSLHNTPGGASGSGASLNGNANTGNGESSSADQILNKHGIATPSITSASSSSNRLDAIVDCLNHSASGSHKCLHADIIEEVPIVQQETAAEQDFLEYSWPRGPYDASRYQDQREIVETADLFRDLSLGDWETHGSKEVADNVEIEGMQRLFSDMQDYRRHDDRMRLSKLNQGKQFIRSAFYESEYCIVDQFDESTAGGNGVDCATDSLQKLVELDLTMSDYSRLMHEFADQVFKNDVISWPRILAFKNMVANSLFYYSIFTSPVFHHAAAHVDNWHLSFSLTSLKIAISSASFIRKLAEDLEESGVIKNSAVKPLLKIFGNFVISKSSLSEDVDLGASSFPKGLQNLKVTLTGAEGTKTAIDSVTAATVAHDDLDVSLDLVGGVRGLLSVTERFNLKTHKRIQHLVEPILVGASIFLSCDKIILNRHNFMQEQIVSMQIFVDAVKLLEEYRKSVRRRRLAQTTDISQEPQEPTLHHDKSDNN